MRSNPLIIELIRPSLALAILSLSVSCRTAVTQNERVPLDETSYEEPKAPASFVANCDELRKSDAFRQNIHLVSKNEGIASICMDLDYRLYLLIWFRSAKVRAGTRFEKLAVSEKWLRSRMAQDASLLNSPDRPIAGIFRIPADASESFATDVLNAVLGTNLEPADIVYQWD